MCVNKTITEHFCHGDLVFVGKTKRAEQSVHARGKTEETKGFLFFHTNFTNTLHTLMTAEEAERDREMGGGAVWKASGIMNSYTCHMRLTDSWQPHFPPLSVFLFLFQSPNLLPPNKLHLPAAHSPSSLRTHPAPLVSHLHYLSVL